MSSEGSSWVGSVGAEICVVLAMRQASFVKAAPIAGSTYPIHHCNPPQHPPPHSSSSSTCLSAAPAHSGRGGGRER